MICKEHIKSSIDSNMKILVGEILTILDASIHEPAARKAVKDMSKKVLYNFSNKLKVEVEKLEKIGE